VAKKWELIRSIEEEREEFTRGIAEKERLNLN